MKDNKEGYQAPKKTEIQKYSESAIFYFSIQFKNKLLSFFELVMLWQITLCHLEIKALRFRDIKWAFVIFMRP